jgi:hypothetical protein
MMNNRMFTDDLWQKNDNWSLLVCVVNEGLSIETCWKSAGLKRPHFPQ